MAKRVSRSKSSDEKAAAGPKRSSRAPRAKAPADAIAAPVTADDAGFAMATELSASDAEAAAPAVPPAESPSNGSTAAASMSSEPSEEDVRLRAYHRFLHRNGGSGSEFDDWVKAEKELRRQSK
jgi:hypothetical protein